MDLNQLKELGLSRGQISVYSAILSLGIATINQIHSKTGIERRNIYDIINKLIEKGFVTFTVEKGKRTYQCTHPNKILEEINTKRKTLKELEGQLPAITSLYGAKQPEIRAEVYRGNEALKALFDDLLNYKQSFWIGGNSGVEKTPLKIWFKKWMQRRVEKKHFMHDLADYGTFLEDYEPQKKAFHKKHYYAHQSLPKKMASPLVIVIFGDKVAQILWRKKSFAFVMESKEVRDSFLKYFNYFWKK